MEILMDQQGEVRVARLSGRLDAMGAPLLEQHLAEELKGGHGSFVIDLGGVEYVSSAGLRCLLYFGKQLGRCNGRLALCNLNPMVAEVFTISGFHKVFSIEGCLGDALSLVCRG